MKKKYTKHALLWLVVSILGSMFYQYVKAKTTGSGETHWGTSIGVFIGGSLIGILSALIFLVLDYFILWKKEIQIPLLTVLRILVLSVIILLMSTRTMHDLLFG